jgi:hypothetical protein
VLTQARLKEVVRYDPETGEFFWRVSTNHITIGERAGCLQDNGYRVISVDGRKYKEHRLAWLYVYGCFPDGDLDHKNRDTAANRIANLRPASVSQNIANSKARPSRSGLKGAHWHGQSGRWRSHIQRDGRYAYLGEFLTAEEAHASYCKVAKELHGEFFNSGKD